MVLYSFSPGGYSDAAPERTGTAGTAGAEKRKFSGVQPVGKEGEDSLIIRILFGIIAVVLGIWLILPDPLPIVADDILAALGSAAAVLLICRSNSGE